jgi:predicted enzyme related to lactoylglutathione lyase
MQMDLGIVVLRVENWYRAVDWYRDVLGLTELYREEAAQWAEFEAGPIHLALEQGGTASANPKGAAGNAFVLEFRVPDLDATVSELAGRGVQFTTDVTQEEWGRTVTFVDLEGNEIQIREDT